MDYKKLIIRGISYSQSQSGAYALLLEYPETKIKIPVVIGNFEAQSISIALEKDISPSRPLTHDLFTKFIESSGYNIISIVIFQIIDGVFYSNINFKNIYTAEELILDARTSDAVALAVRFDAPIYTTNQVLNEAGIMLDLENISSETQEEDSAEIIEENSYKQSSLDELNMLLDKAVKEEDYDKAMEIQKEIAQRNKKID